MEVIQLAGYTEEEKLQIAKRYLVPRQIERNGLKKSQIAFTDAGAARRSSPTTRARPACATSSARSARSAARSRAQVAEGDAERQGAASTEPRVRELLGRPRFYSEVTPAHARARRRDRPGVDAGRRRRAVRRGDRDAGQGQADAHRPARRRDEGVRPGGAVLRARPRRELAPDLDDDWFADARHPRPRARRARSRRTGRAPASRWRRR